MKPGRALVVAPHADDEVLGCGGVIQYLAAQGVEVYIHVVANRVVNHVVDPAYVAETKRAAERAAALLGAVHVFYGDLPDEQLDSRLIDVIVPVEEVVGKVGPDLVFVPNATDSDQDHRAVAEACRVACRGIEGVLAYEVPGPTRQFAANTYYDIQRYLGGKLEAMKLYEGEVRPYPHPRSPQAIEVMARARGIECGLELAEAFLLLRQVVRPR